MPRAAVTALIVLASLAVGCSYPSYRYARGTLPSPAPQAAQVDEIPLPPPEDPELTNQPHIKLLRLPGDGYERGYLFGRTFPAEWKRATDELEDYAVRFVRDYVKAKFLAKFAVRQYAAIVANNFNASGSTANMPAEYRAYIQGIADGAGFDAALLLRNIALVMLSDASCSAGRPSSPDNASSSRGRYNAFLPPMLP